jgi:hypothetical protein
MNRPLYRILRDLHYYSGLFLCPFVLVFAFSVFFLVHVWLPGAGRPAKTRVVENLEIGPSLGDLSGRALIDALKPTLRAAGVEGEAGWVQHSASENKYILPVSVPGRLSTVTLDVARRQASIEERATGLADAVVQLHKSPGPHLVGMRMNWVFMRIWWWLSDATVYVLLFLTLSGIYLWYVLRRDRKPGLMVIAGGAMSFLMIVYALVS